uniref:Uncharacterized protein n=1 Tax=Physcomitrium patens TaxID=3218 RepID=A0A2K1IYJ4_PHYPA|nr:hypothetical protein PHYPA_024163 [Physcomitrium patens]
MGGKLSDKRHLSAVHSLRNGVLAILSCPVTNLLVQKSGQRNPRFQIFLTNPTTATDNTSQSICNIITFSSVKRWLNLPPGSYSTDLMRS